MQAIVSNIAVNMCYAFVSGKKSPLRSWVLRGFGFMYCRQCVPAAVFLLSVNQCASAKVKECTLTFF